MSDPPKTSHANPEQTSQEIEGILIKINERVNALYTYRNQYFLENSYDKAGCKEDDISIRKKEILLEFRSVNEDRLEETQRAQYYYLKGKTYHVGADLDHNAITYLSKAVKLDPKLADAWNDLGECYWKDNKVLEAKRCFETALGLNHGASSLRNLSIVLRQIYTPNPAEKQKNISKSIHLAKDAINFDPSDGLSWVCYGNALLYSYFAISQDETALKNALKAYKMAESDKIAVNQPDLHYNKGMALKYSEEYQEALHHYRESCKLDPSWDLPRLEEEHLVTYLTTTSDLLSSKGKLKAKRIKEMIQSLQNLVQDSDECVPVNAAQIGVQKGKIIAGKVVCSIRCDNRVPFSFGILDHLGNTALVTVYNLADGAGVIIGDLVKISDPNFKHHSILLDSREIKFISVRVDDPAKMIVNGKSISSCKMAVASILSSYRV